MIETGISGDSGTPHLLEDVRATNMEYTREGVQDILLNTSPLAAFNRFTERAGASGRGIVDAEAGAFALPPEPVAMQSAEDANKQYGHLGLKFEAPVSAEEAKLIADTKKRELQAQSTFRAARADAGGGGGLGVGRGALSVALDLVGTAVDPINAASMLLPIVGPAGRAALASSFGSRVAGQAVAGAIEGSVGIGLVQPLITGEALAEQRDTSWWDAAANVIVGGVLGGGIGGLHGWFGRAEPSLTGGGLTQLPPGARPAGGPLFPRGGSPAPTFGAWAGGWRAALEETGQSVPALGAWSKVPVFDREAPMVRALEDLSPETRRIAGETALQQYMGGRQIDVQPMLALDGNWKPPFTDPLDRLRLLVDQRRIAGYLPAPQLEQRGADLLSDVPHDVAQSAGRYRDYPPGELQVDADRFQFKAGGDRAGVTDRLAGVTRWDQRLAGVGIVWQAKDGKLYVVDGHQRHGLATRLSAEGQDAQIHAIVLREADGETEGFARALAAFKNIAEGSGTAIDAAKILRETAKDPKLAATPLPPLPPNSALVRDATSLAKLPDAAFNVVAAGKVPPNQAAHVTRILGDAKQQEAAIATLARLAPDTSEQARLIVEQMRSAGFRETETIDLFGRRDVAESLMLERAKILEAAARALRKDATVFRTLVERESIAAEAGNVLARDANVERLTDDRAALAVLEALSNRAGPLATALNDAARALADGAKMRGQVDAFLKSVRAEGAALRPGARPSAALGDFAELRETTGKTDTIGDRAALERQTAELRATPAEHAQSPLALAEHEHAALSAEAKQALEAHPELKAELEAADRAASDADLFGKAADALAGCKMTGGS